MPDKESNSPRKRIEPYWYIIILYLAAATTLYIYHLSTGKTPDRVAINIKIFDFAVYWYGILIVSGIALGAYVTSRLSMERARHEFDRVVPASIRELAASELKLPEEVAATLTNRHYDTAGSILFDWGLDPRRFGLDKEKRELLHQALQRAPGMDSQWLEDASWRQWNPDNVWSGLAWCLVLGVIGARLYHVLTPSPSMASVGINSVADYLRSPMQLLNVRSGGLGIFGAIIGGGLGIFLYSLRNHLKAIEWTDIAVVGLALGQSIGRWGNFINQELYGKPSDLPWAVHIDPLNRLNEYVEFERFHPTFLYESIWNFAAFLILLRLAHRYRKSLRSGDLLALYLVFYSVGRIVMELFRLDSRTVSLAGVNTGLPVATLISIIVAIPMAILLIYRHLIARNQA